MNFQGYFNRHLKFRIILNILGTLCQQAVRLFTHLASESNGGGRLDTPVQSGSDQRLDFPVQHNPPG